MAIRLHVAFISALIVSLLGCTTTDDPRKGGIVPAVMNVFDDRYDKLEKKKEAEHQEEMSAQEALTKKAEKLRRERDQVKAKLNEANQRLMALELSISQKRAALEKDREKTLKAEETLRQLEKAQAQIAIVKEKLEQARIEDKPVEDLKEQSEEIQKDLDELDAIVDVLAGQ